MRMVLLQVVALGLTLLAWSSDVLHMMHVGADETFAAHHETTGDEEPDNAREEGLDEDAVALEGADIPLAALTRAHQVAPSRVPADDDHSRDLMRPPQTH